MIEGRNAVLEAFRSGKCVDKLFILDGCQDGPVRTIAREARKHDTIVKFVPKERLDSMSETGAHQGVIAQVAAYDYSTVEDILKKAEDKGEPPFIILLDNIEDPHNLGAIIRTANLAGAHGVIIPKHRAVGLTATVAKTSAGALNYTPVAKVANLGQTIDELKEKGIHVCLDSNGGLWNEDVEELFKLTDLVLLDIKEFNPNRHQTLTGRSNEQTIRTAAWLEEQGKPFWLRYVLVPGYSDFEEDIRALGEALGKYKMIQRVEILPYHTLGVHKYEAMGQEYKMKGVKENTPEQLEKAAEVFKEYFTTVVVN